MSLEARLCAHLDVVDESVAPITLQADGIQAEGFYWLRADPVHLQLQRAQMNLHANAMLSVDEAAQLCNSLNQYFAGERFKFFAPHPQRWYVRLGAAPDLVTHPLMQVAGKNIRHHQIRFTPYASNWTSMLTIGNSSASAWAMIRRSNGSRWWNGKVVNCAVWLISMGRMVILLLANSRSINCTKGSGSAYFPSAIFMAISQWLAELR